MSTKRLFFVWKAMPNKLMTYKNMASNSSKISKESISIMLTVNMDGSEKLKPIVIGKSAKPRYFKNININQINCFYRANQKAWMTEQLFKEWLYKLDAKMKSDNRKIILSVDNFASHSQTKVNQHTF